MHANKPKREQSKANLKKRLLGSCRLESGASDLKVAAAPGASGPEGCPRPSRHGRDGASGRSSKMQAITIKRPSLLKELAARRIRLTSQRRVLVGIIQNADRHLDAAALLEVAQKQDEGINRATVYRTLSLLKKLSLIDELDLMHLEGEKHYYEAKPKSGHLHLACFRCGKILEYASPAFERLKAEIAAENDFEISVTRLEVGGLCGDCRRAEPGREASAHAGG